MSNTNSTNGIKRTQIVILNGKSGVGKDTILRKLEDDGYIPIVSHTTRPMRRNERYGVQYYFISEKEFQEIENNNSFIETRVYDSLYGKWYYGLSKDFLKNETYFKKNKYVVILDAQGTEEFIEKTKNYNLDIKVIYIDVNEDELFRRIKKRTPDEKDLQEAKRRIQDDKKRFTDDYINRTVNYVVQNNNLEECYENIKTFLQGK